MSIIYNDSVLIVGKQYEVQEVSKFPKTKSYMFGKLALLVQITNTTASVRFTGQLHEIPVRSLFNVIGYEAKAVHAKNADGFVIKCNNEFGIAIGTAYLEPDSIDETHVKFTIDGKELKLPLDILIALVRKKVKVKDRKVKKEAKDSGVPVSIIEAVAGAIKVPELTSLPSTVTKILPELNIPVLIDQVKNSPVEVFDFSGEVHDSITEAMLSNEKYIHRLIQKTVMAEVRKLLDGQFTDIRDDYDA